jgi:cytochrome c oxidase subunit 2
MTREWPSVSAVALALILTIPLLAPIAKPTAAGGGQDAKEAAVMEFTVIAEKYKFTPERIEVNQGDRVRITVKSVDSSHGWEVKDLDLDLLAKKGGEPETQEFVADRAGTFTITCSEYCGRGHKTMKGTLVVKAEGK